MLLFERGFGAIRYFQKLVIKLFKLGQYPIRGNANSILAIPRTHHAKGELFLVETDRERHGSRLPSLYAGKSSKWLTRVPIPGIEIWISVSGFIVRAPTEVPQQIRSPGTSVWYSEIMATICCGLKIMSLTG